MKYRLADSATDYQLCKQLMAAEQFDDQDIDFPTIMALDDDNEVVGFLATTPNDEMVLAGPLVMRHDVRRPRTAIRMMDLYQITLRGLGLHSIIFSLDPRFDLMKKMFERYYPHIQPYSFKDGRAYYTWPLHNQEEVKESA
jgi:hypothetical protein